MPISSKATHALLGVTIGDAVGVPFEFKSREEIARNPCRDMIGYGTYNLPPGTWSDDSSLTLCLAESLLSGYNLKDMSEKFIAWKNDNYWTARGEMFDIGMTTTRALSRLHDIIKAGDLSLLAKQKELGTDRENGNGALMRIIPLLFYIKGKPIPEQFDLIWEVAALTHRHIRSAMACLIYLKVAEYLLAGENKEDSYQNTQKDILAFWETSEFPEFERFLFQNIIQNDVRKLQHSELRSGGYVMESIEASLWCFLTTDNYKDSILESVNLGHDTDTTAAITGGLSGLFYGMEGFPDFWMDSLARYEDIVELGERLGAKYGNKS